MKRLIFLYMYGGSSPKKLPYDPGVESQSFLAKNFHTEGYSYLLEALLKKKIFDEIIVFIDSTRGAGFYQSGNLPIHVVPNIRHVDDYLKKDDIIWVRGGFRSWHDWLVEKQSDHWLLLYAANTGRARWRFWDVVFDDLSGRHRDDIHQRWFFDFKKPINEDIFKPMDMPKIYDFCIGASHVHDKKGQWKFIKSLVWFKKNFHFNPKCVLPGRIMHGTNTNQIREDIQNNKLNVELTGMVDRNRVAEIMSQSKIYLHMATCGQNDRGPLEAMACGTKIILTTPKCHHPLLYQNHTAGEVIEWTNPEKFAWSLRDLLLKYNENDKPMIANYFKQTHGVEFVVKNMKSLFEMLNSVSKPKFGGKISELRSEWQRLKTMQNGKDH